MPNLNEAWKYDADNLVWSVSVSSAGDLIVAGSWDTHIHALDRKGNPLWKFKTQDFVAGVAVSGDGEMIVAGSHDKHLYALNRGGKLLFKFKADGYVRGAAVSFGADRIAAATWNGTVYMLDRKGTLQWKSELGTNVLSLAISHEGGQVLAGCADKSMRMLDCTGKEIWKLETGSAVLSVASAARAGLFAAGSTDTHVYLLDPNGKLLWKYRTGGVVRGVALSDSGEYLLATSHDRYLYLFEKMGKLIWISKIAPEIWTLATSGMCDSVVLGCRDNTVRYSENIEIFKLQVEAAHIAIQKAEEEGADTREANRQLKEAESASGAGKLQDALTAAGKSRSSAEASLEARLTELISAKLVHFEKMVAELKESQKSSSRVEWAIQRARKLMEARRFRKALESVRKSESYLKGLPPEEPQPLLPSEEEGAAQAQAKGAAKDDDMRPTVEKEFNETMAEITALEKSGADVADAVALLEKANGAMGRKDYIVAAEFISTASKHARAIVKLRTEAADRIADAQAAIGDAQSAGADMGNVSVTLKMATDAIEAGEYELALDYAGQAITQARDEKEKKLAPSAAAKAAAPAAAGAKVDGASKCPNCGKKVKSQWKSCPFCRTRLK
jgi:outer membrane protein assembly factor BamB